MANELGSILSSFGCFDDSEVPSLFDDLETLNDLGASASNLGETNLDVVGSSSPDYEAEMMSIGSGSPQYEASSPDPDHTYAGLDNNIVVVHDGKSNPVMTGAVSPEYNDYERSPSPGGSLTSENEKQSENDLLLYLMNETGIKNISETRSTETTRSQVGQRVRTRSSTSSSASSTRSGRISRKRQHEDDDEGEAGDPPTEG